MSEAVKVAVTRGTYEKGRDVFEQAVESGLSCFPAPPGDREFAAAVRESGACHAVIGMVRYTGPLYDALPRGAVLARYGVGYDNVDFALAGERGILCTNTPGVLDDSVAEYTISLMLGAARRLCGMKESTRQGTWEPVSALEMRGRRLAVIGCGAIGCRVARIASAGFGMEIAGCEIRDVDADEMKREYGFDSMTRDFAEAVREADFVSLHIPSTPATRHFIDVKRLGLMPRRSWLVNTSRGAVVDEGALFDVLAQDGIDGAALDVFETEPYVPVAPGKDLRSLPGTIMTPHVASNTARANRRIAERVVRNLLLAERKEFESMDLLNPEVLLHEK